jgi:hypothetical protein
MFSIESSMEEVISDCPLIKDWIDTIKKSILKSDFEDSKIRILYSYGFFVSKKRDGDKDLFYNDMYNKPSKMLFKYRLEFEFSKLRIDVTINMGKFVMKNRLPKGQVPDIIREMVTEITKIKMMMEESDDIDIYNSIPPLSGLVKVEFIDEVDIKDEVLDMDDILDKISNYGIDSLTPEEKEFLDKKSKDV